MMTRREGNLALAMCIGVLTMFADQASKVWVLAQDTAHQLPRSLTPFFDLVLVWNRGISFGMLKSDAAYGPWLLKGMAALLMLVLLRWLWTASCRLQAAALGLILGGAVGNVIDRFRYGAVVDFLDVNLNGWHLPAFNVADSAICVGVVLLMFESIVPRPKAEEDNVSYLAPETKDRNYL